SWRCGCRGSRPKPALPSTIRSATSPPPGSGFPMLELLHIMEKFDVGSLQHGSAEHVRILFEAMKRMKIDKDAHMGDPAYVD
ncbi:gamma-glutamyltransferase, partial [Rhizobium ruizarguesonis]